MFICNDCGFEFADKDCYDWFVEYNEKKKIDVVIKLCEDCYKERK